MSPKSRPRLGRRGAGYGPLRRVADQRGREVLALPEGFRYVTFGRTGESMSDGFVTPRNHDGMACFLLRNGGLRLIRNHEVRNPAGNFDYAVTGPESTRYDPLAGGGCVSLDFDPARMELVRDFVSLNGTIVNCSGGLAYRDAGWLTCEETTAGPAQGFSKPHGYTFLVGRDWDEPRPAQPIAAMGRFVKEAAVADAAGTVYQTEDAGASSGLYRFLPGEPANLAAGGKLQMLAIRGRPQFDTRAGQVVDADLEVEWVSIDEPDPPIANASTGCFAQGFAKGGARFNRLEGIYPGDDGTMFFLSTSGGNASYGQLWQYVPGSGDRGALVLRFESPSGTVLDSPDNLCVTPRGGLLFCEDDSSPRDNDRHVLAPGIVNVNRLVGLSREGEIFEFAVNVLNGSELAGACFSPDGRILFVNIFGNGTEASGMTCAIAGPWRRGLL